MKDRSKKVKKLISLLVISMIMMLFGPTLAKSKNSPRKAVVTTSDAVLLQWNETAIAAMPPPTGPPFPGIRFMAIVQLAVFEAVNAITGKYEPYLGTITASPDASTEAAAAQAAYRVLKLYNLGANLNPSLDQRLADTLATIPDGQPKIDGIAAGEAAAFAMFANRMNDGSAPPLFHFPDNDDPYEWQITPGCPVVNGLPLGAPFKHWATMRPFAIESPSQFRAQPPPALNSGLYARDLNEVKAYGDLNSTVREPRQTDIARFYQIVPGQNTFNETLRQIAQTRSDEITDSARTIAMINIAMIDGVIAVLDSKFFYRTWRPVTAIPRADEDNNPLTEPAPFTPLLVTPCGPSYPSGHGVGSNAAREVLESAYGRKGHSILVSDPSVPGVSFNYDDLKDITDDIADARVWAGFHFRYDQTAGQLMGEAIGRYIDRTMLQRLETEE